MPLIGLMPAAALEGGEQGSVSCRLQVDAEGRVTKCEVTGSSGPATLDAATCPLLLERARFITAEAVPASWRLPDD